MRVLLKPVQHWVWRDAARRAHRLLRFAEVEDDGGRDLVRAAELTPDPRLRRLYLRHAKDERRHAGIFYQRGIELLRESAPDGAAPWQADWLSPGERGLDDVEIEADRDGPLLAFLHLSESAATRQFADYRDAVGRDTATREVFEKIIRDEEFHMNYTRRELARVAPERQNSLLWKARLGRVWKAYLRFAVALAGLIGGLILTLQYFILLPPFAWLSKRAARRAAQGWVEIAPERNQGIGRQY
jgi:rubrerythrin